MINKAIKKLALYPRLRVFLLLFLVVTVFIIVINLFKVPPDQAAPVKPSQIRAPSVNLNNQSPVGSDGYDQDREQQKQAVVAKDVRSGKSFFTDVFKEDAKKVQSVDPKTFYSERKKIKEEAKASGLQDPSTTQMPEQPAYTEAQLAQRSAAMKRGLSPATGNPTWGLPRMQAVASNYSQPSAAAPSNQSARGGLMIKAGTIHYAVLETGLNSDQPNTPVMATIISGRYKGARLLGGFSSVNERLVIQFNVMTGDAFPESIGINAFAIDADTAANSLVSDVDHHYMLRYGSLFAASFLQGFGQAYQNFQYCPPGVTTCQVYQPNNIPTNDRTISTAKYMGLGQIGTNMSAEVMRNFANPPTVTVDRGTGIGILYMGDVRNGDAISPDSLGGLPSQLNKEKQKEDEGLVQKVVNAIQGIQGSGSNVAQANGQPVK